MGVEILENNVTMNISEEKLTATGNIVTKEPMGVPMTLVPMEKNNDEGETN